ncbi:MAG: hypothetical protein ABI551_25350 [Polyangiaceae bacterium]
MTIRPRRGTVPPPTRDMDASPFASILEGLISRIPGAFAVALVDAEGETVDYAGKSTPFDIKVAAAHYQILMHSLAALEWMGKPSHLVVRATTRSIVLRMLPDGYSVVILVSRRGGFASSERAFSACIYSLTIEAGWTPTEQLPPWFPITVSVDERRRPHHIVYGGLAEPVEVLGTVVGLAHGERGFRVRLASGPEITIVREPGNHWYAEENVGESA